MILFNASNLTTGEKTGKKWNGIHYMKTLETISNCTNTNKEHYLLATMWCREVVWVLPALSSAVE